MTICKHCETAPATAEHFPFCTGHCRAGHLAEVRHDQATDWLRGRLVQQVIRRSWSSREREARRIVRHVPLEVLAISAGHLREMA